MEPFRPLTCPHCGTRNDVHTSPFGPGARPRDGSVTLCSLCGQWAMFEGETLRKLTPERQAEIDVDEEAQTLLRAWRAASFEWSTKSGDKRK